MTTLADDYRFRRAYRLRSGLTIRCILASGKRAAGARLLVVAAPNGTPYPRLASVVGKKVSRKAVERNAIRRLIREAFRLKRADLEAGWDYVVIPLRREGPMELRSLERDLVQTASRAVHHGTQSRPRSRG